MTRHSFDNSGCCHAWAHQTADWGQGSHRRVYFDGPRLYSYGRHFLIAALLPGGLALFNSASYSVSTSQHQGHARGAARHLARFEIPDPAALFDTLERTGILARLEAEAQGKKRLPAFPASWCSDNESGLAGARRQVRHYVKEHAQDLDGLRESLPYRAWHETAQDNPNPSASEVREGRLFPVWLLGLVGLGESTWRTIIDRDTKRRARAKAKAARQDLRRDIDNAKRAADRTDSEVFEVLARNAELPLPCTVWQVEDAARKVAETATRWRRLHKVAKRHLSAKRTRIIWGRIKVMAAEVRRLEALANRVGHRKGIRASLEALRSPDGRGFELAAWGLALEAAPEGQARHIMAHGDRPQARRLARALEALASTYAPEGLGGGVKARAAESLAMLTPLTESIAQVESAVAVEAARLQRIAEVERQAETRRAWIAGEKGVRFHGQDEHGAAYLRAVDVAQEESGEITGGRLQTSQGAEVPLAEAFRAFRFLKLCREAGQGWQANGQNVRVGHFRIESIAPNGDFRAACHFIRWQEVARLAESLGVLGYAADDSAVGFRGAA